MKQFETVKEFGDYIKPFVKKAELANGQSEAYFRDVWGIWWTLGNTASKRGLVNAVNKLMTPPADWKQKLADHFKRPSFEDFNTDEQSIANWIEDNVINN